jgi:hypothetical protein
MKNVNSFFYEPSNGDDSGLAKLERIERARAHVKALNRAERRRVAKLKKSVRYGR